MTNKQELITLPQYFMGRDIKFKADLTAEIEQNARELLEKVNAFLIELSLTEATVSSGWRPPAINSQVKNAAKRSSHMTGRAVDLRDSDDKLAKLVIANLMLLKKHGLWLESIRYTPGWVHLQSIAPGSGKRVFIPSAEKPTNPDVWNGVYDKECD